MPSQVAVAQPGIENRDVDAERGQQRMQFTRQAAITDDTDRLIVEQEGIDIAKPQVLFFATAHQAVAIGDLARRVNRQPERKLGHLAREAGRSAQNAYAPLVTGLVIQIQRKAAGDIHDCFQALCLIQDIAVMPAGCDDDIGAGQGAQKVFLRHAPRLFPRSHRQGHASAAGLPARRSHPSAESRG